MTKHVIVIGAGTAGLASGIRLLNEGYEVTLIEKDSNPGGKMNQVNLDGYLFDLGPTIVMMPELYREVFEIAGRNPQAYVEMERLDPMYSSFFDQGKSSFRVGNDLVSLIKMFENVSDKDAEGFLRYLSDIYTRFNVAKDHFIQRPFRSKKDFYNPFIISQGMKLKTLNSAESMLSKYIKDKRMKQMISFQTLYIGISPLKGPSLYTIIPMIEFLYGVWFIKGGMYSMAKGMAKLFAEMGGELLYNREVEQIVIERDKAVGVQVNEGFIGSDFVICNADFPYAMQNLIVEDRHKGKYTAKKVEQMDYSCSCLVFYFGMSRKYPELNDVHNFIFSDDLDLNIKQIFDGDIVEDPSMYMYMASKKDPSLAPEGKDGIYVLVPVSNTPTMNYEWNDDTLQYYRQRVVEKVNKLPGLRNFEEEIVTETCTTPFDFEEKFNAYNGATFGLMPTLKQSNHLRPQSKATHCEGLYFTGSSTHPGAGVPIVLLSSRITVEELVKDDSL